MKILRVSRAAARLGRLCWVLLKGAYLTRRHASSSYAERTQAYSAWSKTVLDAVGVHRNYSMDLSGRSMLIVANHMSWLDPLLFSERGATTFIAKRSVRRWPLLGAFVKNAGGIFIDRVDYSQLGATIQCLTNRLEAREGPVCFFPEGTTNDGNILLPFTSALFQSAIASETATLPVGIRYESPQLPMSRLAWCGSQSLLTNVLKVLLADVTAVMQVGYPIETSGLSRHELAAQARIQIARISGLPGSSSRSDICSAGKDGEPEASGYAAIAAKLTKILACHGVDIGSPPELNLTLAAIGLDSLDAVPLMLDLEQEFGIAMSEEVVESFTSHSSLGLLVQIIGDQLRLTGGITSP